MWLLHFLVIGFLVKRSIYYIVFSLNFMMQDKDPLHYLSTVSSVKELEVYHCAP